MDSRNEAAKRRAIVDAAREAAAAGLSPGRSGNMSARLDAAGGMLITPSGIPYKDLAPSEIVVVGQDGNADGPLKPSSEWHLHHAIYRAFPQAGGIVHTHSLNATALSCTRRNIPAFHYMVAAAGGEDIRCAEYATFATAELAARAVAALRDRRACLMAHHGQVAYGATIEDALYLAEDVETVAAQYVQVLSIGGGLVLDDGEMARILEKFRTYGQQDKG